MIGGWLRRLLAREPAPSAPTPPPEPGGESPDERLEAAQQRLKQSIPPLDDAPE